MVDCGHERSIRQACRQFNGGNVMIEPSVRRSLGSDRSALCIDCHAIRFHADLVEHRLHKSSFVFTVSIAMPEYLWGRMRLPATDAQFDCNVADVMLHKLSQNLHFFERRGGRGSNCRYLLLYLR